MKNHIHHIAIFLTLVLPLPFLNNEIKASATPVKSVFEKGKTRASEISFNGSYKDGSIEDVRKWELPSMLTGVSGINYLGNNRFACIQDKVGTIYIYNTDAGEIEKEIPFSGPGNFQGIAIAGNTAYAVQSDGKIYEVQDYEGAKPVVKQYDTPLTAKHNVEGLTYDKNNNRLLLVVKGSAPRNKKYKCVYAFDLKSKQLAVKPVVQINLNDSFFAGMKEEKTNNAFQPSAIEIHPVTNDIYMLQSTDPKLLVMDAKGHIKKMYDFKPSEFPQAEGLAFSPEGELFISNGGKNGAATIVKVVL